MGVIVTFWIFFKIVFEICFCAHDATFVGPNSLRLRFLFYKKNLVTTFSLLLIKCTVKFYCKSTLIVAEPKILNHWFIPIAFLTIPRGKLGTIFLRKPTIKYYPRLVCHTVINNEKLAFTLGFEILVFYCVFFISFLIRFIKIHTNRQPGIETYP